MPVKVRDEGGQALSSVRCVCSGAGVDTCEVHSSSAANVMIPRSGQHEDGIMMCAVSNIFAWSSNPANVDTYGGR